MSQTDQTGKSIKILLSAGGTGGHVYPAIALAHDLVSRGYTVHFATDHRGEKYIKGHFDYTVLSSGTLASGIKGKLVGLFNMGRGYWNARRLIKKYEPNAVVGFGGYPSVPAVSAAQHYKIPTILHEQNAIIGKANLYLATKALRIALSLPGGEGLEGSEKVRCVVTGNPVRPDISALFTKPYPGLHGDALLNILIFGGSQGASILSDVIPQAIENLSETYRARLSIVQQCRTEEEVTQTQKRYDDLSVKAECATFFDDMPKRLEETHLVISRSGASTVAEVSVAGRPAIFIPYPYHEDQQQLKNAESIADKGGAWVMPESGFTAEALQTQIEMFLQTPERLFKAAESARDCAHPDAARKLGNLVTAVALGWD
ncbi:MAG: undecaprenyldiphospho-muramoylpentapeptide beta-N-acetylglucosaminyltransferase [Bdellovibrionales bacterium]